MDKVKVREERLGQLKAVLLDIRSKKNAKDLFDLTHWASNTGDGIPSFAEMERRSFSCGTSACALGWAGINPWFRKRGLQLEKFEEEVVFRTKNQKYTSFEAGSEFFKIQLAQSIFLFDPDAYAVPIEQQVGKNMIDRVIKRIDYLTSIDLDRGSFINALFDLNAKSRRKLSLSDECVRHIDESTGIEVC